MDKITIGILDEGVFKWWENENSPLADKYKEYYGDFEIESYDFTNDNNELTAGNHAYWVMDRLLQIAGDPSRIKIISCKVFDRQGRAEDSYILNALKFFVGKAHLINISMGISRIAYIDNGIVHENVWTCLSDFNAILNKIVDNNGFSIISAGNSSEVLSNGIIIENTNLFVSDDDNNLSVASHNESGEWDKFSSVGHEVDVSAVGSNLKLLGERKFSVVSGTSFSAPTFTGICANYLLNDFHNVINKIKKPIDIITQRLEDAIKPVYKTNAFGKLLNIFNDNKDMNTNPWFGHGSYESYAKFFIKHYGRDVKRFNIFEKDIRTKASLM